MAGGEVEGALQEDRDRAEELGAGLGHVALGGLVLQHEHEAGRQGALEHGVHPRRGDGVGQVGDDLERLVRVRDVGDGVVHGVGLEQVQAAGVERPDLLGEVAGEHGVALDRPDLGAGLEQGAGEGAEPGADLDHALAGRDLRELDGFAHDVAIHEEILSQAVLGVDAQFGEGVAGFGGG